MSCGLTCDQLYTFGCNCSSCCHSVLPPSPPNELNGFPPSLPSYDVSQLWSPAVGFLQLAVRHAAPSGSAPSRSSIELVLITAFVLPAFSLFILAARKLWSKQQQRPPADGATGLLTRSNLAEPLLGSSHL